MIKSNFVARIFRNCSYLIGALLMLFIALPQEAAALDLVERGLPEKWSLSLLRAVGCGGLIQPEPQIAPAFPPILLPPCLYWLLLDPPANVSHIEMELNYDPLVVGIDPARSGFLCDFSSGGDCPPPAPGTLQEGNLSPGGPRNGTQFSLVVSTNTVSLNYDLSNNPVLLEFNQNFFALALIAPESPVVFNDVPNTGHLFQIVGSQVCTTIENLSCGSSSSTLGVTFVPEPSTLLLMGSGLAGLLLWTKSKRYGVYYRNCR